MDACGSHGLKTNRGNNFTVAACAVPFKCPGDEVVQFVHLRFPS